MTKNTPDTKQGTLAVAATNLRAAALNTQAAMSGLKLLMQQPGIQTLDLMQKVDQLVAAQLAAFPGLVDTFTEVMREAEAIEKKRLQE